MAKQYFYLKLIPPRPTFPMDMTEQERAVMLEHVKYTHQHFAAGRVLIFGPVMDPAGPFGMAVFAAAEEAEVQAIMENDPSVKSGLNKFRLYPMKIGAAQGPRGDGN